MKVFTFKIYHLDENNRIADLYEQQERYVLAETEEEAEAKLDKFRKEMISKGYADFAVIGNPTVELQNIIV